MTIAIALIFLVQVIGFAVLSVVNQMNGWRDDALIDLALSIINAVGFALTIASVP